MVISCVKLILFDLEISQYLDIGFPPLFLSVLCKLCLWQIQDFKQRNGRFLLFKDRYKSSQRSRHWISCYLIHLDSQRTRSFSFKYQGHLEHEYILECNCSWVTGIIMTSTALSLPGVCCTIHEVFVFIHLFSILVSSDSSSLNNQNLRNINPIQASLKTNHRKYVYLWNKKLVSSNH